MQILSTPEETQSLCQEWRGAGLRLALVPTMGAYHDGHADLMRYAKARADKVVVSLFVNPAQFAPGEDLAAYPRDRARDTDIAQSLGVDALFTPVPEVLYAPDHATTVSVPAFSQGLCGQSRPTHFDGVCLVVLKLFMITMPHIAVFGEKDWQQRAIIRRMTRDLNMPVRIDSRPTVREADGLAMSSRNVYLTEAERVQAPEIYQGLLHAHALARHGEQRAQALCEAVLAYWAKRLLLGQVEYLSVVDKDSLTPLQTLEAPALMACAVRLGQTRLIDNMVLH